MFVIYLDDVAIDNFVLSLPTTTGNLLSPTHSSSDKFDFRHFYLLYYFINYYILLSFKFLYILRKIIFLYKWEMEEVVDYSRSNNADFFKRYIFIGIYYFLLHLNSQ